MKQTYWNNITHSLWGKGMKNLDNGYQIFLDWNKDKGADKISFTFVKNIGKILKNGNYRGVTEKYCFQKCEFWFDHFAIYKNSKTNQCWLVSHVYDDTEQNIFQLKSYCKKNNLNFILHKKSWYSNSTLMIEVSI